MNNPGCATMRSRTARETRWWCANTATAHVWSVAARARCSGAAAWAALARADDDSTRVAVQHEMLPPRRYRGHDVQLLNLVTPRTSVAPHRLGCAKTNLRAWCNLDCYRSSFNSTAAVTNEDGG